MLRRELKESFILLTFSFLLYEFLTLSTIVFVLIGTLLILFKIPLSKIFRNVIVLGVFATYWFTYGKVIDPEVGLNFLVSIIVIKLLEKETARDQYMIFFGLLLVISAGSLFERTLTFVIFFSLSFFVLIQDFYGGLKLNWKIKDMAHAFLWVTPFTLCLFFFAPRLMNPIPFQENKPGLGEVGYTPNVNISQLESLTFNDRPVFHALISRPVPQNKLYWRGNTLSFSDGWDWMLMSQGDDMNESLPKNYSITHSPEVVHQSIHLFGKEDFFFTLDSPLFVKIKGEKILLKEKKTLQQDRWKWASRYEVTSHMNVRGRSQDDFSRYLRSPLSKADENWVEKTFPGKTLLELSDEVKKYFLKGQFTYSLSPGRVSNFKEFMLNKKIGLCSHYASAFALILRAKNIPSRLVSGFMGGNYNQYANFYLISQNDAHVWVEALNDGEWARIDPTEWISPDRVTMGGDAFMRSVTNQGISLEFMRKNLAWINDFRQWFAQWDFRFYQWLEQMDYDGQQAWLSRLRFKRQWLYSILPFLVVLFMGFYIYFLSKHKKKIFLSPHQILWDLFEKRLQKKGMRLSFISVAMTEQEILAYHHPEEKKILSLWKELLEISFEGKKYEQKKVKKKIEKI